MTIERQGGERNRVVGRVARATDERAKRLTNAERFPWEWPPGRPSREEEPPRRPALDGWLRERLLEQRVVLIQGHLDNETATSLSAQILSLDAAGTRPVQLRLDSPDGDLTAALALVDTFDALVAPVHLVAAGEVGGASLALLTAADHRAGQPHARFRLGEPRTDMQGSAGEVMARASQYLQMLDTLIVRLSELTGKPRHQIETDLCTGRYLTAAEAKEYGLLETVHHPRSGDDRDER